MAVVASRWILPLERIQLRFRGQARSSGWAGTWEPAAAGRTSGNPNLTLALSHFPLDVSNKSKRLLMVPSASRHVPLPTLGRRTATEQTLSRRGICLASGTLALALTTYVPGPPQLMRSRLRLASSLLILELMEAMFADWVLKARPRVTVNYHRGSGAAVAQATRTPQPQIEFTIF